MATRFWVRVAREHLVFCAGHFISYAGDQCERLHGHNYRVSVEAEGPLDENRYVVDFIALKKIVRQVTEPLDHRMLLPAHNAHIVVQTGPTSVEVTYRDRRWIFPAEDCVILPVANTTAEELARYLAGQIRQRLIAETTFRPGRLRVEVEEAPGQSACYEEQDDSVR